jgi:phosphoribosylformylglycinamidine cyclo-ligase
MGGVKALVHITGGGITENTPRVLPGNVSAEIDPKAWRMPDIFTWLQDSGNVSRHEMLRTFNCGIGMILVVEADRADAIQSALTQAGETVHVLGRITERKKDPVLYL